MNCHKLRRTERKGLPAIGGTRKLYHKFCANGTTTSTMGQ